VRRPARAVSVGGDDTDVAAFDETPAELLALFAVVAAEARRVHLERPSLGKRERSSWILEDGLGALGMCDHRREACRLDVRRQLLRDFERPRERQLDEHTREVPEAVA
jgi:hypothetical protein